MYDLWDIREKKIDENRKRVFNICSDFLNFEELCSFVLEQLYVKIINQPLLPAGCRRLKTLSLMITSQNLFTISDFSILMHYLRQDGEFPSQVFYFVSTKHIHYEFT